MDHGSPKNWIIKSREKDLKLEMIEKKISNCLACQATTTESKTRELYPNKMPNNPWDMLSLDFYGPIENFYYVIFS